MVHSRATGLLLKPLRSTARVSRSHARNRKIWTSRTVISDDPEELLASLPSRDSDLATRSTAAIFTVSRSVPPSVLSKIVDYFQSFPSRAIGCLSLGNEDGTGPYTLSHAVHHSPENTLELVIPFRSDIEGVPKIALGREVGRKKPKVHQSEWAGDGAVIPEDLPDELSSLNPDLVSQVIHFTDEQPQGLMKALDAALPGAEKLGLLASSTPFFTGRSHTMISGKDIFSKGACGVAVCRYPAQKALGISLDYGALKPLGEALEVTVAKGNIILELAGTNATRLLLERIQQGFGEVISKEQGFYMGILPEGESACSLASMIAVRPILAGDPSRGALSLDTEANIAPGQYVQFFHTPATPSFDNKTKLSEAQASAGLFGPGHIVFQSDASSSSATPIVSPDSIAKSPAKVDDSPAGFFAASEHGYIVGRPGEASWICSVQSSSGAVRL